MGELADLYNRIEVVVRSPDKTVTLRVTGFATCAIELAPNIRRRHTEESLERQLLAVFRVAIAATMKGVATANARVLQSEKKAP